MKIVNPRVFVTTTSSHEHYLFDFETLVLLKINASGMEIWRSLEDELTPGEIVERVVAKWKIDREVARRDVNKLCRELAENGFITTKVR